MKRYFFIVGSFGVVALALVGANIPAVGQVQRAGGEKHAHFMKCAEECNNCQRICEACAAHCAHLMEQGKKEHHHTMQTCQDCATHCSAAASITARHGPFSDTICKACMEACARCAKECERHSSDAEMKRCAEECRRCEQVCRDMIGGAKTTERRP
jgi:hypothetical protein